MKVIILKEKLDALANAIGIKAKRRLPQTIDELIETVELINPKLQAKTVTPKKTAQTVTADQGYDGLAEVDVKAAPLQYRYVNIDVSGGWDITPDPPNFGLSEVLINVPQSNLPTSGAASYRGTLKATIGHSTSQTLYLNIPKGFINSASYYTIPKTPTATYDPPTATKGAVSNHSVTITPSHRIKSTGYIYSGNQLGTDISVSASELVSGTLTVSSAGDKNVTNYATASIPAGTAGTPTAAKGAVSNHSVSVTPSVTNTTGFITGSTKTGTAVTVTASELASGTKSITANGTGIDVVGYEAVDVNVAAPTPTLQTISKTYTPTTSQQTESVTADQGYDGLSAVNVTVNAMPTGSVTAPSTISGTAATVSTGNNTLTLSKTVSVTPNVTQAGYVSAGTAGNSSVSLTANVTTQAAQTIYPSTSDQTINSGRYLTGNQTIKGVTYANLTADNIKNGVTITIGDSADADRITSVTGTYTGGGGTSKNAQVVQQNSTRITSTSYTKACGDITVSKTGTYDVYWTAYRTSTSGTWGTQLYIGGAAYGTAQTTFNSYYQAIHLSNISLTANQTVAVYGRSRGSNYYLYVGQLTIIEA